MTGFFEVLVLALVCYGLFKAAKLYLWVHRDDCPRCGAAPRSVHRAGCRHVPDRVRR